MKASRVIGVGCGFVLAMCAAVGASAQPLGTFVWQLAPYCNRISVVVVQQGTVFALSGFDDQCGAATSGSVAGSAFPNPDGTVGLGLAIVGAPGGSPVHVDATVSLATLNGIWRDSAGVEGTFVFNGAGGGDPRPLHARTSPLEVRAVEFTLPELTITGQGMTPNILSVRTGGTPAAPAAVLNGDTILLLDGAGHNGGGITARRVGITMVATENWAASANGTAIWFSTSANGTTLPQPRMAVDHDGNVGIGTIVPSERLHVNGAARIGSCTYETDGDVACVSDARFKRGIRAVPAMLDRLAALEPVRFTWRTDEFPDRGLPASESMGLIAQDVEQVLPDLVTTDADGYKTINYGRLPLLAIKALKELKEKNDALERRLSALEERK